MSILTALGFSARRKQTSRGVCMKHMAESARVCGNTENPSAVSIRYSFSIQLLITD